jgi:hypothetical protein
MPTVTAFAIHSGQDQTAAIAQAIADHATRNAWALPAQRLSNASSAHQTLLAHVRKMFCDPYCSCDTVARSATSAAAAPIPTTAFAASITPLLTSMATHADVNPSGRVSMHCLHWQVP